MAGRDIPVLRPLHHLNAGLSALGGFMFGYDTGLVGGAVPYIKKSLGTGGFGESPVGGSLCRAVRAAPSDALGPGADQAAPPPPMTLTPQLRGLAAVHC
jgi:hypothetical protein